MPNQIYFANLAEENLGRTKMEHNVETCPVKKQMEELEQNCNVLQANLQLSAVYGKSLLDEINVLKRQIKDMQTLQEVFNLYYY